MKFTVIIPARYASSRLPGKPLMDICGRPMIVRVVEQALQAGADRVVVATDDSRIEEACRDCGADVCMTSKDHNSGTERLSEVVEKLALKDDEIVVNVQGDEPLIPPENIRQVAELLDSSEASRKSVESFARIPIRLRRQFSAYFTMSVTSGRIPALCE